MPARKTINKKVQNNHLRQWTFFDSPFTTESKFSFIFSSEAETVCAIAMRPIPRIIDTKDETSTSSFTLTSVFDSNACPTNRIEKINLP